MAHFAAAFVDDVKWQVSGYNWDSQNLQSQPVRVKNEGIPALATGPHEGVGVTPVHWQDSYSKQFKLPKGPMVCQVEGCGKDLTIEKGYYQRYRVCEQHLKLLSLMVDGKASRFCQQCGRFHILSDFEGNKRSCRARLQQHNARRRKREPASGKGGDSPRVRSKGQRLSESSPEASVAEQVGGSKNTSQDLSGGSGLLEKVSADLETEQSLQQLGSPSPHSLSLPPAPNTMLNMPRITADGGKTIPERQHASTLANMSSQMQAGRPLSDVSLSRHGSTYHSGNLDDPAIMLPATPFDNLLLDCATPSLDVQMSLAQAAAFCEADFASSAADTFEAMYQGHPTSFDGSNSQRSLPNPFGAVASAGVLPDIALALNKRAQAYQPTNLYGSQVPRSNGSLSSMHSSGFGISPVLCANGMPSGIGPGSSLNGRPRSDSSLNSVVPAMPQVAAGFGQQLNFGGPTLGGGSASALSGYDLARQLVAGGGAAAQYHSEDMMLRISIKIANCTPEQLPSDLYLRLRTLLATADISVLQGFLRPGCTHLVVDVLLPVMHTAHCPTSFCPDSCEPGSPALVLPAELQHDQLRQALGAQLAEQHNMLVQVDDHAVMFQHGKAVDEMCVGTSSLMPVISYVTPAACLDNGTAIFHVYGTLLTAAGTQLFCRSQGGYLPVTVTAVDDDDEDQQDPFSSTQKVQEHLQAAGLPTDSVVQVVVRGVPQEGLVLMECQQGAVLSNWKATVVLSSTNIVDELLGMQDNVVNGSLERRQLEEFVLDFGRVLDHSTCQQTDPAAAADALIQNMPEMLRTAEQLLAYSCDTGLACCASHLLALLSDMGQSVEELCTASGDDGLTLLHRCVRSGKTAMLMALMRWAQQYQVDLALTVLGEVGITPLHLAACLPAMQASLCILYDADGPEQLWLSCLAKRRVRVAPRSADTIHEAVWEEKEAAPEQLPDCHVTVSADQHGSHIASGSKGLLLEAPAVPAAVTPQAAMAVPRTLLLPIMMTAITATCLFMATGSVLAASLATLPLQLACRNLLQLQLLPSYSQVMTAVKHVAYAPTYRDASTEALYQRTAVHQNRPWDVVGAGALLLLVCVLLPLAGCRPSQGCTTAAILLIMLPLLLQRYATALYIKGRNVVMLGLYCAALMSCRVLAQKAVLLGMTSTAIMLYIGLMSVTLFLLPIATRRMLLLVAVSLVILVQSYMSAGAAEMRGPGGVCVLLQTGVMAAASSMGYVRELTHRQHMLPVCLKMDGKVGVMGNGTGQQTGCCSMGKCCR